MYSGSVPRSAVRSASMSAPPTTYATSRASPPSSRTITAQSATPSRRSAASISPGSMRKPRTFTCRSARPMNSSVPSAFQRARSPVRYNREPGWAEKASGTKRSAVSAGRPR
jgi:hypothetical protein